MASRRNQNRLIRDLFDSMPLSSKFWLYAGVFFCFAPIGLLQRAFSLNVLPWGAVTSVGLFAGAVGVAYVMIAIRCPRRFPVAIALHILASVALGGLFPQKALADRLDSHEIVAVSRHLSILVGLTAASTVLAYVSFFTLFRREGLRFSDTYAEVRLAKEIHTALVPALEGRTSYFEWHGLSRPSGDVGGDLVDVFVAGRDDWNACVADVSGHGWW